MKQLKVLAIATALVSTSPAFAVDLEEDVRPLVENTVVGATSFALYDILTGRPCVEGNQPIIVSVKDPYGLETPEVQRAYLHCPDADAGIDQEKVNRAYEVNRRIGDTLRLIVSNSRAGKVAFVTEIYGLDQEAVADLAQLKMPGYGARVGLAKTLGVEKSDLNRALKKILEDAATRKRIEELKKEGRVRTY
jgi:hypothetical protein